MNDEKAWIKTERRGALQFTKRRSFRSYQSTVRKQSNAPKMSIKNPDASKNQSGHKNGVSEGPRTPNPWSHSPVL